MAEEHRDLIPRPPSGGSTTDFIVTIFAIMVASVLIILTVATVLGTIFGGNDKATTAYFAVLTDIMTTVIGALVGYLAGRGSGRAEGEEAAEQRRERAEQRQFEREKNGGWAPPSGPPLESQE